MKRVPSGAASAFAVGAAGFAIAGFSVVAAGQVGRAGSPFLSGLLGVLPALPILAPFFAAALRRGFRFDSGAIRAAFLQAASGVVAFRLCCFYGVPRTGSAAAGLVLASGPLLLAWGGRLFFRDAVPGRVSLCLAAACACSALSRWSGDARVDFPGLALVFMATVGEAAMSLVRRAAALGSPSRAEDGGADAFLTIAAAALIFLPGAAFELARGGFPSYSPRDLAALAFYGIVASGVAYLAWSYAAARLPSWALGLCNLAAPPAALLGGVLFLGEPIGLRSAAAWTIGFAAVCAGAGAVRPRAVRTRTQEAPEPPSR